MSNACGMPNRSLDGLCYRVVLEGAPRHLVSGAATEQCVGPERVSQLD